MTSNSRFFGLLKGSAGLAESNTGAAVKSITIDPAAMAGTFTVGNAHSKSSDQLFGSAAWYFACMVKRARALSGVPHSFYKRTETPAGRLPFAMPSATLLYKTELDWLAHGSAYWLAISNRFGVVKKIRHVVAGAIELDHAPDDMGYRWYKRNIGSGQQAGNIGSQVFERQESGLYQLSIGSGRSETLLTLMPLHAPSHLVELGPGIAAGHVAGLDASVLAFVSEFLLEYFGGGGVSKTLIKSERNYGSGDTAKAKAFKTYINNILRSRPNGEIQVLPSDLAIEHLVRPLKELSIPEISAEMRRTICAAFETPEPIVTGEATNRGDSDNVKKGWYDDTIGPESIMLCDAINQQLVNLTGYRLRFHPERMELYQQEEVQRATAYAGYVAAMVHPDTAAAMLGLDIPEGYTLTGGAVQATPAETPVQAEIKQLHTWAKRRAKAGKPLQGFKAAHLTAAQIAAISAEYQPAEVATGKDASFRPASADGHQGGHSWASYP